ncbi:MAG: hypothetical protein ACYTEQ_05570 [Planctomycetota bacterium]|jgi:hypothetical protein
MAKKLWVGKDTGNEGDWATAANWSPSGVPANGDDVYLRNSGQDVSAGLNQSAVTLASLNIAQSYTGKVATETAYLQIGATSVRIGYADSQDLPAGSSRIKLDLGMPNSTVVIENCGTSADANLPPIRLLANNSTATSIQVLKGQVGIAVGVGETSTIKYLQVGYVKQPTTDADVFVGAGVTINTSVSIRGGDTILNAAAPTITVDNGTLTTEGSGTVTTLNVNGGTVYPNSSGTITTLDIDGGTVDFTRSQVARTVTTVKLDQPGILKRDPAVVTFTNKVDSDEPVCLTASAA